MIDPALIAERTAAIAERDAAVQAKAEAEAREAAALARIDAVHTKIAETMVDGEIVTLHPTPVDILMRVNGKIEEGTLKSVHTAQ